VVAREWLFVDHHFAHALGAFADAPFASALVLSYDATGAVAPCVFAACVRALARAGACVCMCAARSCA
jgi:predicted NodU family carbamoyl transferase